MLIITSNVNTNTQIKRKRLDDGIKNQEPITFCLQEVYLKDTSRLKQKGKERFTILMLSKRKWELQYSFPTDQKLYGKKSYQG